MCNDIPFRKIPSVESEVIINMKNYFNLADHLLKRLSFGFEPTGNLKELPQTFVSFNNFEKYSKEVQLTYESKSESGQFLESIKTEMRNGAHKIRAIQFNEYCKSKLKEFGFIFENDSEYYSFVGLRVAIIRIADTDCFIFDNDTEIAKEIVQVRHNLTEDLDIDLKIMIG